MTSATQSGRIDRARFDAATFPSEMSLQVRFDDLDPHWHVNNAAIALMLQEARVTFDSAHPVTRPSEGLRTLVAAMAVEFASEITYPGFVEIGTGVSQIGRTSFTIAQRIRFEGRGAVYSTITMVLSGADGAVPLPGELRALIETAMISG